MQFALLLQAASTWAMVGLIWFVQIVHYPLMSHVGAAQFAQYEQLHQRLTTWVVAPLMLAELAVSVWLCYARPAWLPAAWVWVGCGLVALIWLSTACFQVPAHDALSNNFSEVQHRWLVTSNWTRTIAWSLRGFLVLLMLSRMPKH